jgi:hypothetical protein
VIINAQHLKPTCRAACDKARKRGMAAYDSRHARGTVGGNTCRGKPSVSEVVTVLAELSEPRPTQNPHLLRCQRFNAVALSSEGKFAPRRARSTASISSRRASLLVRPSSCSSMTRATCPWDREWRYCENSNAISCAVLAGKGVTFSLCLPRHLPGQDGNRRAERHRAILPQLGISLDGEGSARLREVKSRR